MKVYELAKKLDVTSVFLMNKIKKEWKLPVKNHMETLSPDLLKTIEKNFQEFKKTTSKQTSPAKKKSSSKKAVKKTVVKKSAKAPKKKADTKETKEKEQSPKPVKKIIIRLRQSRSGSARPAGLRS